MSRKLEDLTEYEFLELLRRIYSSHYKTERQHTQAVFEFIELSEHPSGSDLIFYPKGMKDDTPEGIVEKVKAWRSENGKPGFKKE